MTTQGPERQAPLFPVTGPAWRIFRLATLALAVQAAWLPAQAQTTPAAETPAAPVAEPVEAAPPDNSSLDAPMFYQLLVGEMEAQNGRQGVAFEVLLDAARRLRDPTLYQRAIELAVQGRSGDKALQAVQAWRQGVPESLDAARTHVQLLVALDKPAELAEPLGTLIRLVHAAERSGMISGLPRFLGNLNNKAATYTAVEQAFSPWLNAPATRTAARTTLGRMALLADKPDVAMALARRAHADDDDAAGPIALALELAPTDTGAEAVVQGYLARANAPAQLRLAYARMLEKQQRIGDAATQVRLAVASKPELIPPWLTLGAYLVDLREPTEAITALERFLALQAQAPEGDTTDDDESGIRSQRATDLAWQLLSQAHEQLGHTRQAAEWLERIDSERMDLSVLARRASLMARNGQLTAARALLRDAPAQDKPDARARLLAEAQLLRDNRDWQGAHDLLLQGMRESPEDTVLIYELAMVAERLAKFDEMEALLRRVMALKPDDAHAFNALGYSLTERNTRLDEARLLLRKATALAPNDPFIVDSLGWVEFRLGNKTEALKLLRQSWLSRPHAEVAAHLGEVLWSLDQRDEALKIFREGLRREAANEVLVETMKRLKAAP